MACELLSAAGDHRDFAISKAGAGPCDLCAKSQTGRHRSDARYLKSRTAWTPVHGDKFLGALPANLSWAWPPRRVSMRPGSGSSSPRRGCSVPHC